MAILSCSVLAKTAPSRAQCVFFRFCFLPAGRIQEARVSEKQNKRGLREENENTENVRYHQILTYVAEMFVSPV